VCNDTKFKKARPRRTPNGKCCSHL
jgi:hypothetical protein